MPIKTWKSFKEYVAELEPHQFVFRGQKSNGWRLRTKFHRTERANLVRFLRVDIPALWQRLSALTRRILDLGNPLHHAAFVSLVQHHGYPTPMLDWTTSPFIAAFFAYQKITNADARLAKAKDKIRIIIFDKKQWMATFKQMDKLSPMPPHLSFLDPIAFENTRLIPQQATLTVTNLDDIETYVRTLEATTGKSFIQVIDLPVKERSIVMRELSMMGITAGSLFPGIDGTCEELKEQFFQM